MTLPEAEERVGPAGGMLTILFAALVAGGAVVALLGRSEVAEKGQPAPPLTVTTFEGEVFDLEVHLAAGGGPVLLNLWASWCPPCIREFPLLSAYAEAHPHVTVVGVAVQDRLEDAQAFVEATEPGFVVAFDHDGSVGRAYPSFGLPATFLIGSDGTVTDVIMAELTAATLADLDFAG